MTGIEPWPVFNNVKSFDEWERRQDGPKTWLDSFVKMVKEVAGDNEPEDWAFFNDIVDR